MKRITTERFTQAINAVAASEDGQVVLAVLADSCGWDKTYLSSDKAEVTQYYAARRGVYGGLRNHIKPQYLKKIEFDFKIQEETTNERGTKPRRSVAADRQPTD